MTKFTLDLLHCAQEYSNVDTWDMLLSYSTDKNPRYFRPMLHWAIIRNRPIQVIRALVTACPEALVLKDDKFRVQ